jgi:hypothetical protein
MPSLSLDESKGATPIAVVRGGEHNGELLYLDESRQTGEVRTYKTELSRSRFDEALKPYQVGLRDRSRYYSMLSNIENTAQLEKLDIPEQLKEIYKSLMKEKTSGKSILLPDESKGIFQPIPSPDPKKRQIWYICGASGAGKSWFARGVAENYRKLYPERDIFLVSKLNEDETLDNMKGGRPKRIKVQSLVDSYPENLEDFRESLIIFDDFDTFDKPYSVAVQKFIDDVASMGRHTITSMMCISHLITNFSKTRLILNEAHFYVVYPNGCSAKGLNLLLGTYAGLDKHEIDKIRKMDSRWACVFKNYPPYIITERESRLLNTE